MTRPSPASGSPALTESGEPVYSVSQLNREVRGLLEGNFPSVWVTGEISNLARPASGHLYFSLKDDQAQVRCALFRPAARNVRGRPENGQQVLVRARLSLYEVRGEYQLIVDYLEPAGDGVLLRRLEELKRRLAAEGLFAEARKRPLPALPRCVGVVTSPTGAAVRDILHVLGRRFPAVPVVVYPVQVQGERAKHDIVQALATAGERTECDVLIVARGGGSLEDLWAFNEEIVVRAIHDCPIPVVSGVGHEVDFTLADFVADVRAPTPSAAAELVVPDWREVARDAQRLAERGLRAVRTRLRDLAATHQALGARLRRCHPGVVLRQRAQRIDELAERGRTALLRLVERRGLDVTHLARRLAGAAPLGAVREREARRAAAVVALQAAMRDLLRDLGQRLAVAGTGLHAVSPLATLDRGYAIVADAKTGAIVTDTARLKPGQSVTARLAKGRFRATVDDTDD